MPPNPHNSIPKPRAPRNRTLRFSPGEAARLASGLFTLSASVTADQLKDQTINQDLFQVFPHLPPSFVDLLFVDPPYNLTKHFNSNHFKQISPDEYEIWVDSWLSQLRHVLKPTGSIYVCGDWRSASALFRVLSRYFIVRNRITWEREKGRGAKTNWKNSAEDIWFATASNSYTFNVDAAKLKRKVIAPYRDHQRRPKDWATERNGNYRTTHPSNLWTDLTVPFWSMPENTDHPTQKPEKLLAKIIMASSNRGDFVFDPFLGSGTTSVVAKKLGRQYSGVEVDKTYCCLAEKRLELAEFDKSIQGYTAGVFWERNTLSEQLSQTKSAQLPVAPSLFITHHENE